MDRIEESRNLALGERLDLLFLDPGERASIGRVQTDIAELQSLLQSLVEYAVGVLDCLGA